MMATSLEEELAKVTTKNRLGVKNKYIADLLEKGTSGAPIQSHWQGASRLANALLGGYELGQEEKRDQQAQAAALMQERASADAIARALGGGGGPAPMPSAAPPMRTAALPPSGAMPDSQGPFTGTPPTSPVIPSGQQATEGMVSAVPQSGPAAGQNIAQLGPGPSFAGMAPGDVRALGMHVLKDRMTSKPTYGVTGQDRFGNPVHGWIDPATRTTTPATGGGGAQFKDVLAVSKDVQALPSYKNLAAVAPLYGPMVESAKIGDRGADLDLVYGLAKIIDPQGVVREDDSSQIKAIASLPAQIRQSIISMMTSDTGRLDQNTRTQIMRIAHGRLQGHLKAYEDEAGRYRSLVKKFPGIDEADVVPKFGPFEPLKFDQAAPTLEEVLAEKERRRRGGR